MTIDRPSFYAPADLYERKQSQQALIQFVPGTEPFFDEAGLLHIKEPPAITAECAMQLWAAEQERVSGIDRTNFQVVFTSTGQGDLSSNWYARAGSMPTEYKATVERTKYDDGESRFMIEGARPGAQNIYIVASLPRPRDYSMAIRIGFYYKVVLRCPQVTLVTSYVGSSREDKTYTKDGTHVADLVPSGWAQIQSLRGIYDRMIVIEPHSPATQAFAAISGIPTLPISPWEEMIKSVLNQNSYRFNGVQNPLDEHNTTFVRPDIGRNLVAERIARLGLLPVANLSKHRLSSRDVTVSNNGVNPELIRKRRLIYFDDEIATGRTIGQGVGALAEYDPEGITVIAVHNKLSKQSLQNLNHPLIKEIVVSDTRRPFLRDQSEKIRIHSLVGMLESLILTDISTSPNYWSDPRYANALAQRLPADQ